MNVLKILVQNVIKIITWITSKTNALYHQVIALMIKLV